MNDMAGMDLSEFRERGMIDPVHMRVIDRNAMALGVSSIQLMESAGSALARCVREEKPDRVLILCGRGNNGGDGLVAARHLQYDAETTVLMDDSGPVTPEVRTQRSTIRHCAVTVHPVICAADVHNLRPFFESADVIVDAMLGTGAAGTLREPLRSMADMAGKSEATIIAADLPSPGMRADRICAFHRPKCRGAEVLEIGIPLEAEIFTGPGDLLLVPRHDPDAHKGAGGEVLVVGGGPYQGAPYLTAMGALRAGADLVHVATPAPIYQPDIITEKLDGDRIRMDHLPHLLELAGRADVVVCGPGLGGDAHDVVTALADSCRRLVIDADALRDPLPAGEETIYTPHAGEFHRITGIRLPADLLERARLIRDGTGNGTFLVKGAVDIISDGRRVRFNRSGSPAMTTGGTGDVLAGVVGALFCHLPPFDAACTAAYINGVAGERAAARLGRGMTATDLISEIAPVIRECV
ncbi:MAG: NAD(P)H-hydrate dehydratase [Methanoculleaceae archaeon]